MNPHVADTVQQRFRGRIAAHIRDGQPRVLFRHPLRDEWGVIDADIADGSSMVIATPRTFDSSDDAIAAFMFPTRMFDPRNAEHREDAAMEARFSQALILNTDVAVDPQGRFDPRGLITAAASGRGESVRATTLGARLDWVAVPTPPVTAALAPVSIGVDAVPLPFGGEYWPRLLHGHSDVDMLRDLRGAMHMRLKGRPGGGKTGLAFAAFGDDIIYEQGHDDLTASSLLGQYIARPDGAFDYQEGRLVQAMRGGKVFLLDEANRAPEDVHAAILSATDDRAQVILPDRPDLPPVTAAAGFTVIYTYNDLDAGTRPIPNAALRRLPFEISVDTDYDIAAMVGCDARLIQVATNLRSGAVETARTTGARVGWYPQMADLKSATMLLNKFGPGAAAAVFTAACDGDSSRIAEAMGAEFGVAVDASTELGPPL